MPTVITDTVFARRDSVTIYQNANNQATARIAYLRDSLKRNKTSQFKLGDFTEASVTDTVFIVNKYINAENALPATTSPYSPAPV